MRNIVSAEHRPVVYRHFYDFNHLRHEECDNVSRGVTVTQCHSLVKTCNVDGNEAKGRRVVVGMRGYKFVYLQLHLPAAFHPFYQSNFLHSRSLSTEQVSNHSIKPVFNQVSTNSRYCVQDTHAVVIKKRICQKLLQVMKVMEQRWIWHWIFFGSSCRFRT